MSYTVALRDCETAPCHRNECRFIFSLVGAWSNKTDSGVIGSCLPPIPRGFPHPLLSRYDTTSSGREELGSGGGGGLWHSGAALPPPLCAAAAPPAPSTSAGAFFLVIDLLSLAAPLSRPMLAPLQ